jgi:hypothetical protein
MTREQTRFTPVRRTAIALVALHKPILRQQPPYRTDPEVHLECGWKQGDSGQPSLDSTGLLMEARAKDDGVS